MSDWQPIETAPLKELVLVYEDCEGVVIAEKDLLERWRMHLVEWDAEVFPTHWMPLPKPPTV